VRGKPLSLTGDPGRVPPDSPPGPVDVIVPVCGAAEAFARCVESVVAHTDLARHRLVLALDGPQPAATEALVSRLTAPERPEQVLVSPSAERRGFVAAVNRGMALSARDVVLLNSDTQVTAGWLAKLQAAAGSAPEIATATPFSNSATICSLPRFLETNALPAGWSVAAFGRRVEERSRRAYPRLPTGVGVCLYIKRKALDQVGLFDEASFGLGYGEESEWSMRALKAGYAHVLDDATFIFHEGQRSFGAARGRRVAAAHRAMRRLHPEYMATVAAFLRADPLAPLRERVTADLAPARHSRPGPIVGPIAGPTVGPTARSTVRSTAGPTVGPTAGSPARVLHVVHGWPPYNPAGTELYAAWLARRQAAWRDVAAFARLADPARELGDAVELLDAGVRVRLLVNNFTQRDPRSRNALRDRRLEADFARLLDGFRPDLVHVHHLAGHALALPALAARRGIPVVYQLQDWWAACARANLLDRDRRLCSGPGLGKCSRCLPATGIPPAPLWNRALYAERGRLARRALASAAAFVCGSRFIDESYRELGLLPAGVPVHRLEYGIELDGLAPGGRRADGPLAQPLVQPLARPLACGFVGSILPHKGLHVAVAAFRGIDPAVATLTAWGEPAASPAYAAELAAGGLPPAVRLAGRFPEEEKGRLLAGLDLLVIPSLGLESFGLVGREAMACGVPVLASRRGALVEMLAGRDCGALFAPGDAAELAGWIGRLAADPSILAGWRRNLPPVRTMEAHAEEIEGVYAAVLAGRLGARAR
jgi:glycosyltransferase involved in cell wall biosynthesis/GT2 family glycosyltransferase